MGNHSSLCLIIIITSLMCSVEYVFCNSGSTIEQIAACLAAKDVRNFTTFPSSNGTSSFYYDALKFSLQNLRYSDPSLPKPIAIIMPENVDQLRSAVLCSREATCKITIRSGGHSYEATSSVAAPPPFVVIDLLNLDRVTIDLESESAWVEGGATLGQAYYAIAKASGVHALSAGSCPTVGVGGHFSGGGFGLLSRKYGLAADNVVDALLVDANAQLLDRAGMGEDVFWAIRGGGGGLWGVIYAWKIKLLRVPPTVTAFSLSRTSRVADLVHKWQHVAPNLGDDLYLSCFVGANLPESENHAGLSATFKGLYMGAKAEAVSLLAREFPELGIAEQECVEMSWIESVVFFSGLARGSSPLELRNRYVADKVCFKAKSDYVRRPVTYEGVRDTLLKQLEKQPKGFVVLDPYGGIMDRISSEAIAFPHRKGNLYSIQYMVEWEHNEGNIEYMNWIRSLYNSMAAHVSSNPRAAYVNYMDFDLGIQNSTTINVDVSRLWGQNYFLNNFDRLVRAKTQIDPLNVFSHPQGIPPISALTSI